MTPRPPANWCATPSIRKPQRPGPGHRRHGPRRSPWAASSCVRIVLGQGTVACSARAGRPSRHRRDPGAVSDGAGAGARPHEARAPASSCSTTPAPRMTPRQRGHRSGRGRRRCSAAWRPSASGRAADDFQSILNAVHEQEHEQAAHRGTPRPSCSPSARFGMASRSSTSPVRRRKPVVESAVA